MNDFIHIDDVERFVALFIKKRVYGPELEKLRGANDNTRENDESEVERARDDANRLADLEELRDSF